MVGVCWSDGVSEEVGYPLPFEIKTKWAELYFFIQFPKRQQCTIISPALKQLISPQAFGRALFSDYKLRRYQHRNKFFELNPSSSKYLGALVKT